MKSLKRTLSLVLALVMVLGLFGGISMTAAATDFTDDADVQYHEAVDVMTAIGAINGMDDGTFQPKNTITRAQAATLVARTVLGYDVVDNDNIESSFTDVPSTFSWAIPSIEYLVKQGVINGMGDGTFHPNDPIEGYAVLKMLLCAIGYGAKDEYTGDSWKLNVAIDASKEGTELTEGLASGVSQNNPATREEVALYCFNAIQAPMVKYLSTLDVYVKDDAGIGTGTVRTIHSNVYKNLGVKYAYKLDSGKYVVDGKDAMGNPANVWTLKGALIGEYPVESAASFNIKQLTAAPVAAALKGLQIDATNGVAFTINGKESLVADAPYDKASNKTATDIAQHIMALSGNGTIINLHANEAGELKTITVVKKDTATVASNNTNGVVLKSVDDDKTAASYTITAIDDLYDSVKDLKAGDLVVVTPVWNGAAFVPAKITVPTTVSGKLTTNITKDTFTVDGETYGKSAAIKSDATTAVPDGDYDATLYIDEDGFVVNVKAGAAKTQYFAFVYDKSAALVDGKVVEMADVVYTDGTTDSLPVADGATTTKINRLVTPTIGADGKYTLTLATEADGADTNGADGASKKYATLKTGGTIAATDLSLNNSSSLHSDGTGHSGYFCTNFFAPTVKFVYINSGKVVVVDGVQAVSIAASRDNSDNTDAKSHCVAAIEDDPDGSDKSVVTAVFLPGQTYAGAVDPDSIAYVANNTTAVGQQVLPDKDGKNTTYKLYEVYVNGERKELALTNASVTANTFYSVTESKTTEKLYTLGTYNDVAAATKQTDKEVVSCLNGTTIKINLGASKIDLSMADAKVVDVRTAAQKKAATIEETPAGLAAAVEAYSTVKVSVIYDTTKNAASTIYIVSNGAAYRNLTLTGDTVVQNDTVKVKYEVTKADGPYVEGSTVTITVTGTGLEAGGKTSATDGASTYVFSFDVTDASGKAIPGYTKPADVTRNTSKDTAPAVASTFTIPVPTCDFILNVTAAKTA